MDIVFEREKVVCDGVHSSWIDNDKKIGGALYIQTHKSYKFDCPLGGILRNI